jgi:cell wall-associated NlpC family hydrolase
MSAEWRLWADPYIGVSYLPGGRDRNGWDCLGLVRTVLAEQRGIEIPSFDERYTTDYDVPQIAAMARREALLRGTEVGPGSELPFDLAMFRTRPLHCGIVVEFGLMLSVQRGAATCLERYYGPAWKHRLIGFWRLDKP